MKSTANEWAMASIILGSLIVFGTIAGYVMDIAPFHLHPDYSKDSCIVNYGTPDAYDQCMRMNPEFNPLPILLFLPFVLIPAFLRGD